MFQGLFFIPQLMRIAFLTIFIFLWNIGSAQTNKGSLRHYQRTCKACLQLPGFPLEKDKFQILIDSSAYSGGTISIKKLAEENYRLKKVALQFDARNVTHLSCKVKGNKNRSRFAQAVSAYYSGFDPNARSGSISCTNGNTISYSAFKTLSGTQYRFQLISTQFKEPDPIE